MKRLGIMICAAFALMFAGSAFAGGTDFSDGVSYAKPAKTWNHCYTGVKGGAEFANVEAAGTDYSQKGYLIAGALGCRNQVLGNFVYGLEVGGGFTNADGTVANVEVDKDSFVNIKLNAGYSFGQFKPGVFIGYEWSNDDLGDPETWIAGIEANYRFVPRWSLDFTAQTTLDPGDGAYNGVSVDTDDVKVMVGLSYIFPGFK